MQNKGLTRDSWIFRLLGPPLPGRVSARMIAWIGKRGADSGLPADRRCGEAHSGDR